MQLAFDIASKEIGIPDLLDVEDVCDVAKPDERSLMTYIAYWFHAFSQMERVENAGRRVEKFVTNMQGAWGMQNSFEQRMRDLLQALRAQKQAWKEARFTGTYVDAKEQSTQFAAYKRSQKRRWVAEKSDLAALLGNIKTKMSTYRLRAYEPPNDLKLEALDKEWAMLLEAERHRSQIINETIREYAIVLFGSSKESIDFFIVSKMLFVAHLPRRQIPSPQLYRPFPWPSQDYPAICQISSSTSGVYTTISLPWPNTSTLFPTCLPNATKRISKKTISQPTPTTNWRMN